jgi:ATP-binding protein involved in chromosome partitioning
MTAFRQLRLQKVEETAPGEVTLTWGDGRVNRHRYRPLRLACRCAVCRDEHTGEALLDPATVAANVHPTAIEPVGAYALRFVWSDGHSTGMFPYAFLYESGEVLADGK